MLFVHPDRFMYGHAFGSILCVCVVLLCVCSDIDLILLAPNVVEVHFLVAAWRCLRILTGAEFHTLATTAAANYAKAGNGAD